jgi:hypothetical protein
MHISQHKQQSEGLLCALLGLGVGAKLLDHPILLDHFIIINALCMPSK